MIDIIFRVVKFLMRNAKPNNHFRVVKLKNAKIEREIFAFGNFMKFSTRKHFFAFSRFWGVNFTLVKYRYNSYLTRICKKNIYIAFWIIPEDHVFKEPVKSKLFCLKLTIQNSVLRSLNCFFLIYCKFIEVTEYFIRANFCNSTRILKIQ